MTITEQKLKPKSKPKLLELDLVRAFAILAVVIIHATSEATVELPPESGSRVIYLLVNKLSNFAVPVFILLSGLVLFYRYQGDFGGKQAFVFYKKRVRQVLFPYLIWSLFYYLYNQWIFAPDQLHFDAAKFGELLPWADASYHLYFMVIIVQFYLLFPLMMWLCQTMPWIGKNLIWIGVVIQAGFYLYHYFISPFEHMASLAINYFSMFTLGGWIGLHYEAFNAWLKRSFKWVLPAALLIGVAFVGIFASGGRLPIQVEPYWYEVLFFSYAAFGALVLIRVSQLLREGSKRIAVVLAHLGIVSFGVYLMHPAVLTYFLTHVKLKGGSMAMYHGYTILSFLITLIIPWLAVTLYGRFMRLFRRKRG